MIPGTLKLTAEQVAIEIGIPTGEWAGHCHGISMAVAPLVGGVVRRGYFTGEVNPDSYFGAGGLCQHSWVELPNGQVLDPTRHAISGGDPILWIGSDDEYDIGGCKSAAPGPHPPAQTDEPTVFLQLGSISYFEDLFEGEAEAWFSADEEGGELALTIKQALWLANLPVKDQERQRVLARWFAAEAYEALVVAGQRALIPIDRLDWILPDWKQLTIHG